MKIPAGPKLLIGLTLSICAFGARTPYLLTGLTVANVLMGFFVCVRPFSLFRRGIKLFLYQSAMILLLYLLRFGIEDGVWPGLQTSWQLFLAFFPGMIFMESTSQPRIVQMLSKIMPPGTAFVLSVCMKFIPLMVREIRSIYETQVLRGANMLPKDLLRPWNWPDFINCLLVPAIVRTLSLSGEIALAARARDFGIKKERTCWPGE
ncbi:MAG: energy-coupling factor transporter transmembrane protein EcfT [Deltaproteobacteria bacterium]|nr:energy-coupling factor transporter transmembrane protein EcfT [Deltaproteobacteria bacterium]